MLYGTVVLIGQFKMSKLGGLLRKGKVAETHTRNSVKKKREWILDYDLVRVFETSLFYSQSFSKDRFQ